MAINENLRFFRAEHVVVCEIKDGGALLDLETSTYFQLNGTANFIWDQLALGPLAAADIAEKLSQTYDVDDRTALIDVKEMLAQFSKSGLIIARK